MLLYVCICECDSILTYIFVMAVYRQGALFLRNLITQTTITTRIESRNIKRWISPTLKELKRRKDKLGPQPEIPRSSFIEWNYQAELYAFGKRLNEEFDKKLLEKALTNRSYIIKEEARQQKAGIDTPIIMEDNNSLIREGEEFIIECVKDQLKTVLPKFPSEGINAVCNYLTSNDSLANVAFHIGLKDITLCSEYPPESTTLTSTFKAVIAALCTSSGHEKASLFIQDFVVLRQLVGKDINDIWQIEQPLEMLSKLLKSKPEPRLCNQSASNTILANYEVGLYVDKKCVGSGWGESIDIAIEMAARDGLKRLFGTTDSMPAIRFKQLDNVELSKNRAKVHN